MKKVSAVSLLLALLLLFSSCGINSIGVPKTTENQSHSDSYIASVNDVPEFNGEMAYVVIRENEPDFSDSDLVAKSYEKYSKLDYLGRCGVAVACVGKDIMPTEERGSIGQVKPSGWQTVKYDFINGKYLYNRCHLIGFQLTGENANEENLITGTRYLNVEGMLPFENMVADYVKETGNHVLYRVTPVFDGDNLLARGVQIEAKSVEDSGEGICFNVYAYNNQPGVEINYKTGESKASQSVDDKNTTASGQQQYVLNTNTKKFHLTTCSSATEMNGDSKKLTNKSRDDLIKDGYTPCKKCNP